MLTDIRLQNFRSYRDSAFELSAGVNIIVGPNASGKTNLLEAILVLSTGKSYRAKAAELIAFNKPWARLDAHDELNTQRSVQLSESEQKFTVNNNDFRRMTMDNQLPAVVFEPNHLMLVNGKPEQRRAYIDDVLERVNATFKRDKADYLRTLAQRNSLLKMPKTQGGSQLFAWNIKLSEGGGKLAAARTSLINELNPQIGKLYAKLAKTPLKLTMVYKSPITPNNYASDMLKKLEASTELDYLRGFTGTGPHRDDIRLLLDNRDMQESASRGETRTALIAIKIAELEQLEKTRQKKPILLLDDVFSELDGKRRKALTAFLKNYQTFITTTDADIVIKHFTASSNIIPTSGSKR